MLLYENMGALIRVTVEMVPNGISAPRHMATIEIENDVMTTIGTSGRRGDYIATVSRISQNGKHLGNYDYRPTVKNVARYKSGAVYRILYGILKDFLNE